MALTKITSDGITDGTVANADINASAAIDVSKLSGVLPLAGGTLTGSLTITSTRPTINLTESDADPDYQVMVSAGEFKIKADGKTITELEKNEKIDKNLLRYLTVRVKKFDLESDYFKKSDGNENERNQKR